MLTNQMDSEIKNLLTKRSKEIELHQKNKAYQLKGIESKGKKQIEEIKNIMHKDLLDTLNKLEKVHIEQSAKTKDMVSKTRSVIEKQSNREFYPRNLLGPHFTPNYTRINNMDGSIYWDTSEPAILKPPSISAVGSGSGLFGTGIETFSFSIDWYYTLLFKETSILDFYLYIPFHGYYIVYAMDGLMDSKEASAKIDLCLTYFPLALPLVDINDCKNIFSLDSQNIDVNGRIDSWKKASFNDLVSSLYTYFIMITATFTVYARGGGSHSELNFSSGNDNYIGIPLLYVNPNNWSVSQG
ncbi:MAG: hypothetical protein WBV81_15250 [Ignavibacteriaceae bacterium]